MPEPAERARDIARRARALADAFWPTRKLSWPASAGSLRTVATLSTASRARSAGTRGIRVASSRARMKARMKARLPVPDIPVPPEAIRLAMAARADALMDRPDPTALSDETLTRLMLEAAAPLIAAAGRERIAALLHAIDDWDEIRALTAALAAGKDGRA